MHPAAAFVAFLSEHLFIAYPALFLGAFLEILIPFSFFIPGEIFFYSAGILSALGYLNPWIAASVLILGGYLGDLGSFLIGKRYAAGVERFIGKNRFASRIYARGKSFVRRHDTRSILLARFLGPTSWVVPFLAGSSEIPFQRFALLDLAPAVLSIAKSMLVGYAIGLEYSYAARFITHAGLIVLLPAFFIILGIPFIAELRHHRTSKKENA